jgi:predicted MFS family arabinose efflux permease
LVAGLPIGLTLALIFTVPMIGLGESVLGTGNGWRMPFFISGAITLVVGFGMHAFFKGQGDFSNVYMAALRGLSAESASAQAQAVSARRCTAHRRDSRRW